MELIYKSEQESKKYEFCVISVEVMISKRYCEARQDKIITNIYIALYQQQF